MGTEFDDEPHRGTRFLKDADCTLEGGKDQLINSVLWPTRSEQLLIDPGPVLLID